MSSPENQNKAVLPRFLILIGSELSLAGLLTSILVARQNSRIILALSVAVLLAGTACIIMALQRERIPASAAKALNYFGERGYLIALVIPVILSAYLLFAAPTPNRLQILGGLLICFWLIGLEALFFFRGEVRETEHTEHKERTPLAVVSLLLAYGILLLPSRLPSILDGIPWNKPVEFVLALLVIPFAFVIGRDVLGRKKVTIFLAVLFAAKLILMLFLPQAGLGVRAYFDADALQAGKWERSYGTFASPGYTEITMLPYRSFREFPVEWMNQNGVDLPTFWLALELNGFIHLREDEKLVFLVLGAPNAQIELTDAATHNQLPAAFIRSVDELSTSLYDSMPVVKDAELRSLLIFPDSGRRIRFEPLLLHPDGSSSSALPAFRLSSEDLGASTGGYQFVLNLIEALLIGILLISLAKGFLDLYQAGNLGLIDIYLAASGLILYYIVQTFSGPNVNIVILVITGIVALIKAVDLKIRPQKYKGIMLLLSFGLPLLVMFLALDLPALQSIEFFPKGQDSLEYQFLAHNIYVNGDIFLAKTPPWAYKVLFPYIVGVLHILFGQSASAQFFLNACSAVLSCILISRILVFSGISAWVSVLTSMLYPMTVLLPSSYIYFFRFGLIEPPAILCLLAAYYFALRHKAGWMFIAGTAAALLRLNFIGAIMAATLFVITTGPLTGTLITAWKSVFESLKTHWKLITGYLVSILAPALLITLGYSLFIPHYTLSPNLNKQTSLGTVLQSLFIVIFGGDPEFLRIKLHENAAEILLIAVPVAFGFLLGFISIIYRKEFWRNIDMRWSLALISFLPVYAALKPIAYFPRYSWSPLPFALILLAMTSSQLTKKMRHD